MSEHWYWFDYHNNAGDNEPEVDEPAETRKWALRQAEMLWKLFGEVPVNDDGITQLQFLEFPMGTDREEIWHWFEDVFGVSVAEDLMGDGQGEVKQ
jgi:hypothetical protein